MPRERKNWKHGKENIQVESKNKIKTDVVEEVK
jgi:hypothetical protein